MISRRTERFWAQVDKSTGEAGCWVWKGHQSPNGYGLFGKRVGEEQREVRAHRFAYTLMVGPIEEGLTLDHLCRNRLCVNPGHLEAVSLRENILRGEGATARNAAKTHCKWGHPFDLFNTFYRSDGRRCRACEQARERH